MDERLKHNTLSTKLNELGGHILLNISPMKLSVKKKL